MWQTFYQTTQYHTPEGSTLTHIIISYESHVPYHTKSLQQTFHLF